MSGIVKASPQNEVSGESTWKYWVAFRAIVWHHEGLEIRWEAHGMRGESEFEEFLDFGGISDLTKLRKQCQRNSDGLCHIASMIDGLPTEWVDAQVLLLSSTWAISCRRMAAVFNQFVEEAVAMQKHIRI